MIHTAKPQNEKMSRREWLPRCVRAGCLTAMAVFGVGQVYKGRRLANDPNCIRLNTCNDCVEFGGCKLDKAETFRESQKKDLPG